MQTRDHYMILIFIYLSSIIIVVWLDTPLVTIFILLVLLFYSVATTYMFQSNVLKHEATEKKQLLYRLSKTEKQTSEIEQQFNSLSDLIDTGLVLINDKERIVKINQAFIDLFNVPNVIGKSYNAFKKRDKLYRIIEESYIRETKIRQQIIYEGFYLDILVSPIFEDDVFRGSLVIVHDITQIKTAETFQKQFTADVSHELKTPLSAIVGISEILSREEPLPPDQYREFANMIYKESTRLDVILNDLLILSKMDRIDYELHLEKTDIRVVVEEAVSLLKPLATEKKLTLESELESCDLTMDKGKIKQVIINLIKNAINYTDAGEIQIYGQCKDGQYKIQVKDTGIGIKKEEHDKIFKRFYRVDDARSRFSGGSGLGLSIVKNVIKKHNGEIELLSEIDQGTTITVRLPI